VENFISHNKGGKMKKLKLMFVLLCIVPLSLILIACNPDGTGETDGACQHSFGASTFNGGSVERGCNACSYVETRLMTMPEVFAEIAKIEGNFIFDYTTYIVGGGDPIPLRRDKFTVDGNLSHAEYIDPFDGEVYRNEVVDFSTGNMYESDDGVVWTFGGTGRTKNAFGDNHKWFTSIDIDGLIETVAGSNIWRVEIECWCDDECEEIYYCGDPEFQTATIEITADSIILTIIAEGKELIAEVSFGTASLDLSSIVA